MWPKRHKHTKTSKEAPAPEHQPNDTTSRRIGMPALRGAASPEVSQRDAEIRAFDRLRADTHASMRSEYANRIATNPAPTASELSFGMYAENLEPQVRNATFQMREKGYSTTASGFFHGDVTWRILGIEGEDVPYGTYAPTMDPVHKRTQTMDFSQGFNLDQHTLDGLAEAGAEVVRHPADNLIYRIGFVPDTPDIRAITTRWDTIASMLPDTGAPVPAAETFKTHFDDWGATAP